MARDVMVRAADDREIRAALGRLCTRGVVPWWIREKADVLLDLPCVAERVRKSNGDLDDVGALIEILRRLVDDLRPRPYGTILRIVLGLDSQYLDLSAEERRARAGEEFRGGEQPVSAGTIRQLHEKAALDRLTALLVDFDG